MYNNYGFNPYYSQQKFQPIANQQPQQYMQPIQPLNTQVGLLGKIVDSIDVVKAMDIPLDGNIYIIKSWEELNDILNFYKDYEIDTLEKKEQI